MFSKLINTRIQDIILSLPGDICRNVIIFLRAYIDSQTMPGADTDPTALAVFELVRMQIDPILARRQRAAERRAAKKAEAAETIAEKESRAVADTSDRSDSSDKSVTPTSTNAPAVAETAPKPKRYFQPGDIEPGQPVPLDMIEPRLLQRIRDICRFNIPLSTFPSTFDQQGRMIAQMTMRNLTKDFSSFDYDPRTRELVLYAAAAGK